MILHFLKAFPVQISPPGIFLGGSDNVLTSKSSVCELHFEEDFIIRNNVHNLVLLFLLLICILFNNTYSESSFAYNSLHHTF